MHHLLGKFRKFPGGGPPDPPMAGTNLLVGKRPQARVAHSLAEVPSIVAWPPLLRFVDQPLDLDGFIPGPWVPKIHINP